MAAFIVALFILSMIGLQGCGGGGDSAASSDITNPDPGTPGSGGGTGQGSSSPNTVGPTAPPGARVIEHIEDKQGWGHCSDCAARVGRKHPPIAVWDFKQHQNTPSLDGSSIRMYIGGSAPYANALHWVKFDGKTDYSHFLFEFDFYASPESLQAENLEFDLFQARGGKLHMFGTQCNYQKGIWQSFDPRHKWVDLPSAPCKKFAPKTWTHVKWLFERSTDGKLHYVSVTVGKTTHKVNNVQPPAASSWDNIIGVQFQQDMNKAAADYAVWVDRVKVSMW